jgi:hypothetical protein
MGAPQVGLYEVPVSYVIAAESIAFSWSLIAINAEFAKVFLHALHRPAWVMSFLFAVVEACLSHYVDRKSSVCEKQETGCCHRYARHRVE